MVNMADQYLQGAGREVDVQKAVTFGLCFHMLFSFVSDGVFLGEGNSCLIYKVDCQMQF